MARDTSYPTDRLHVRQDGRAALPSGAILDIEAGAKLMQAGTELKIKYGEATLDGTNPTSVATGLGVVVAAVACFKTATALGDDPNALSVDYGGSVAAGQLDLYAWKNTSGTDPTQVASTNNSIVVSWIAIGTS